jgi:hypothetical protein
MRRLVGNDRVPEEIRPALRKLKAVREGLQLRRIGRAGYPALWKLPPEEQAKVRSEVVETLVWEATAPRFTADGRRYA